MIIKYDRIILERARDIASTPGSTQRDLARFANDCFHLTWNKDIPYADPDVHNEIVSLMKQLPRRKKK